MDYPELRLGVVVFFLASWLQAAVVVGHNDHGVHKNYLIIVRSPYEYDRRVYKDVSSWHASLLASVCDQAKEELEADPANAPRLIYSYRNVVNGFSARLTADELGKMAQADWFVKAVPEKTYQLMTTHTPRMLGLTGPNIFHGGVWKRSNMGEGIIIGVLDGGITPGHPSFDGTSSSAVILRSARAATRGSFNYCARNKYRSVPRRPRDGGGRSGPGQPHARAFRDEGCLSAANHTRQGSRESTDAPSWIIALSGFVN